MSIFSTYTSTIKGVLSAETQKVSNALQTVKAAVTGKGVQANTPVPVVNTALSYAASNPFLTASLVTPLKAGTALTKAAYTQAPKTVIGTQLVAPVVTSALVTQPDIIRKAGTVQSGAANVASNAAELLYSPSTENLKKLYSENPIIATGLTALGAYGIGKAASGILPAVTNLANTAATKANTAAIQANTGIPNVPVSSATTGNAIIPSSGMNNLPQAPATTTVGSRAISTRHKTKTVIQPMRQSVRINIINNSRLGGSYIKKRAYYG